MTDGREPNVAFVIVMQDFEGRRSQPGGVNDSPDQFQAMQEQ